MCIRDSVIEVPAGIAAPFTLILEGQTSGPFEVTIAGLHKGCLLYTSDAADERSSVDLGGRRIIKKKNKRNVDEDGRRTSDV